MLFACSLVKSAALGVKVVLNDKVKQEAIECVAYDKVVLISDGKKCEFWVEAFAVRSLKSIQGLADQGDLLALYVLSCALKARGDSLGAALLSLLADLGYEPILPDSMSSD